MPREIVSKYGGTCTNCWEPYYEGQSIIYDADTRSARHPDCTGKPMPEPTGTLKVVVDWLRGKVGELDEFEMSLLGQYEVKGTLSEKQINAIVKRMPDENGNTLPGPDEVPAGKYALPVPEQLREQLAMDFYFVKVWRGSKNSLYVRCYLLIDELENENEIDAGKTLGDILEAGAAVSARMYGRRKGRCSQCEKPLTVALSRKLDIGPVCGAKFYSDTIWGLEKMKARMWLRSHGVDPTLELPLDFDMDALEQAEAS